MFVSTPLVPDAAPLARMARGNGRIVWQQRYEGIAHVAYRGGKAVAGISGPWSDRYALIWWDRPRAPHPLELFASLDEAMRAVEEYAGEPIPETRPQIAPKHRDSWLHALWPKRPVSRGKLDQLRRRFDADTDLSGLSFMGSANKDGVYVTIKLGDDEPR